MRWLSDFWFGYAWPSDKGNGPEAIQQTVVYAAVAVLVWPRARRAAHRFVDRKADAIKAHMSSEVTIIHNARARADADLHAKLDETHRAVMHVIAHHPDIPDLPPPP